MDQNEQHDSIVTTSAEDACRTERTTSDRPARKKSACIRELIVVLLLSAAILLGVHGVLQSFRVDGSSMLPSLRNHDLVLVNKAINWRTDDNSIIEFVAEGRQTTTGKHYLFRSIRRGDIIVFPSPSDPRSDYIKRVIGLPGDTVDIRNSKVFVNDKALQEEYISGASTEPEGSKRHWLVPPDKLFVLGDNRSKSRDSRTWGFVAVRDVIGRAVFIYWPVTDMGKIPGTPS